MSTVVFLAGLGQPVSSWDRVRESLPEGIEGIAIPLRLGPDFTFESRAREVMEHLDSLGLDEVDLCGLSIGAMVALQCAAEFPQRIRHLILSGGQVYPHPVPVTLQIWAMRLLPPVLLRNGWTKEDLLPPLQAIREADLRPEMARVRARTLVLCGARDIENLGAAKKTMRGIPGAQLQIVPGVGHTWNVSHPEVFARYVSRFIARAAGEHGVTQVMEA